MVQNLPCCIKQQQDQPRTIRREPHAIQFRVYPAAIGHSDRRELEAAVPSCRRRMIGRCLAKMVGFIKGRTSVKDFAHAAPVGWEACIRRRSTALDHQGMEQTSESPDGTDLS